VVVGIGAASAIEDAGRRRTRRISLALLLLASAGFVANVMGAIARSASVSAALLTLPVLTVFLLVVACAVSFGLSYTRRLRIAQVFQFALFIGAGYSALFLNSGNITSSGAFFVLALFLGIRYGLFDRRPGLKAAILIGLLLVALGASLAAYGVSTATGLVGVLLFLVVYAILWYFVAEQEIRDLLARSRSAEDTLRKHKKEIDIGRSAIGIFHGMSGRLMALDNAIRAVEKDGKKGEVVARLREAQSGIAETLTNIKRAVVHQSTEEEVPLRLGDLVKGLLETFRAECESGASALRIGLDLQEDAEVLARPVDLYTMFENVARNAAEAGAAHLTVTVGPERSVIFANDGPAIPACRDCPHHECMSCPLFQEGKTSKPGGSGIGMVYVRNTMAKYGNMRITSGEQGTEMLFHFRPRTP
jgi:signal transduction histidine kinase